jgi:hypothetical protein
MLGSHWGLLAADRYVEHRAGVLGVFGQLQTAGSHSNRCPCVEAHGRVVSSDDEAASGTVEWRACYERLRTQNQSGPCVHSDGRVAGSMDETLRTGIQQLVRGVMVLKAPSYPLCE